MARTDPATMAPGPVTLRGQYCTLEPLVPDHAQALFEATSATRGKDGRGDLFRFFFEHPPESAAALRDWIIQRASGMDPLFFAVVNRATGRCGGRQALMRVAPAHRCVELGSVLWGRGISRTAVATEAFYLTACHVFDHLQYNRLEWKCDDRNEPSKAAARRFGFRFEGLFRHHMIVKGALRDTAWFAMLHEDWQRLKPVYDRWLDPENFDSDGQARTSLNTPR